MGNYIVNHSINGLDNKKINDIEIVTGAGNNIVVVLDDSTKDSLNVYYNKIVEIILSNNKLIVIGVGEESNIERAIFTLMCSYRCYNIYKVDNKQDIDKEYIDTIIEREPTFEEVQTFIGGNVTAYAEINNIILKMQNLVLEKNLNGLTELIEKHMSTIVEFTEVVEYMRAIIANSDNTSLKEQIEELNNVIIRSKNEIQTVVKDLEKARIEKAEIESKYTSDLNSYSILKMELEDLKNQSVSGNPIMKSYTTINTSQIKCKTKIVVYFKEISKIPYVNSLINYFMEYLKIKKFNTKLLVYDNQCGINSTYNPLTIVGGSEYMANKDRIVSKIDKIVVVEPNPAILTDILTSINNSYDIVIVYDRMGQNNDIVSGNNVYKIFVANSSNDIKNTEKVLKIIDSSVIVTRDGGLTDQYNANKDIIQLPKIDGFSSLSNTAKCSKYWQLKSNKGKVIISYLCQLTKINSLGGR